MTVYNVETKIKNTTENILLKEMFLDGRLTGKVRIYHTKDNCLVISFSEQADYEKYISDELERRFESIKGNTSKKSSQTATDAKSLLDKLRATPSTTSIAPKVFDVYKTIDGNYTYAKKAYLEHQEKQKRINRVAGNLNDPYAEDDDCDNRY